MNLAGFDGLVWVVLCLLPLLLVQRWLHRELQAVFLLLTRRPSLALGLFSFLFFPGVVLHETSHFVTARLLGVKTGRFSLLPKLMPDGHLRLGYVETARCDPFRDSLIGTAPLLAGGAVILYLGSNQLGAAQLSTTFWGGQWQAFWQALSTLPARPDFWLWFYLAFAVSTTMLPSASDRQGWLPLGLVLLGLLGVALVAGAGPWMLEKLAPPFNQGLLVIAAIFGTSLVIHLILLLPVWLVHKLLSRVTGLDVVD